MSKSESQYKLQPGWVITQKDKFLLISGGADSLYEIELDSAAPSFFARLNTSRLFTAKELVPREQRVLEELVLAEIIVPVLRKNKELKTTLIGDKNPLTLKTQKDIKRADIVIVARTNSTLANLLNKINYHALTKPHLFVDMAYHHTLSVGPLVFPGETACVACLRGRISERWGDDQPPLSPNVTKQYADLTTALVKTELSRIANNDTSLTNKTVSWNFQDRVIKSNQLLKVPFCPICNNNKVAYDGSLILPWTIDENATNTV